MLNNPKVLIVEKATRLYEQQVDFNVISDTLPDSENIRNSCIYNY
ncbi:hypothetical protein NBRC116600_06160 [Thalassotalea sp. SU-HH00458]